LTYAYFLRRKRADLTGKHKGRLKIFLGYAAGVGKTYQMLVEARRLKEEGRDVVIGYFEPHGRKETIAQTEGLEFVPRGRYEYRGSVFEDMDTDAVIARHPRLAAVDELAHANVPGSQFSKRWQDVVKILDAGIDVVTSVNVQHLESLNDQVWQVTGIKVRETVPDWVFEEADEVVMVDLTPRALLHRLERGVVYSPEKAREALRNFFTESNLTALREMALRQTAHQLEEERLAAAPAMAPSGKRERILLWLTPHPSTAMLIRRGRRVADFLGCRCDAVYVRKEEGAIEPWLNICANLRIGATAIECKGNAAKAIAAFARVNGVTQVYVTRNAPKVNELVDQARDLQITVVAERVRPV
jgi:two-component system, OmpR family, sensor histidine kinase KdpD